MKQKALLTLFFFITLKIVAQQEPHFTQYMYNMSVVNPAYAKSEDEKLNFGALYRMQWVGIPGSPRSLSLFGHGSISDKFQTGISVLSDEIGSGIRKETQINADLAYIIDIADGHKISLGIKGGLTDLNVNFNGIQLEEDPNDVAFSKNIHQSSPNIGIGAFYFTDNYYFGISAPSLFFLNNNKFGNSLETQKIHTHITGGYAFDLNDQFKLKPAFMAVYVYRNKPTLDFTLNVRYIDMFELGVAYRVQDAVSMLMNIEVFPGLRIGYSYDYTLTSLTNFNYGSHEIGLLYSFEFAGRGHDTSPRFY